MEYLTPEQKDTFSDLVKNFKEAAEDLEAATREYNEKSEDYNRIVHDIAKFRDGIVEEKYDTMKSKMESGRTMRGMTTAIVQIYGKHTKLMMWSANYPRQI